MIDIIYGFNFLYINYMSIRVLKAKAQSRRLVAEKNSVAKKPVNLYYSPNKGLCCPTNPHEPNPSGGIYVPKEPAPQKSYGNYNRQAMLGYSGLARRVVSMRNSQTNNVVANPERNTFKRMPKFSQGQHLYNLSSKAVLCKDKQARCAPVSPKCFNNEKSCNKSKISITKDIGYLSAGDYTQRKVGRRVKNTNDEYELKLAKPGLGRLTC
tara:strand:+ start:1707 stop:2336 length:630 start_codon:yes stop_codon:yes gene_type:complete